MKKKKIAIVGGGPRGLYALESLILAALEEKKSDHITVTLIDPSSQPGCSHVYDLSQPDTNWVNISERALMNLPDRPQVSFQDFTINSFPDYSQWNSSESHPDNLTGQDIFPARSHIGQYLKERYNSLAVKLYEEEILTHLRKKVTAIVPIDNQLETSFEDGGSAVFDEVLLTIGHQPTEVSNQLSKWRTHASVHKDIYLFEDAYPISNLMVNKDIYKGKTVALRGFGLAMIDVTRALTEGLGGEFILKDKETREMIYKRSGKEPKNIIPFSLDGLPVAPKPLTEKIDQSYSPDKQQKDQLKISIRKAIATNPPVENIDFLLKTITDISAEIYSRSGFNSINNDLTKNELSNLIFNWLNNPDTAHSLITKRDQPAEKSMREYAGMAADTRPVSLDYCVGQVWRQLQPLMYEEFPFSGLPAQVIMDIVSIDERIKRYSFGPPLDSIQQLIALIDAGILKNRLADDPDIKLNKDGWVIESDGSELSSKIMINNVLDSPVLTDVSSPLIKQLLANKMITPLHKDLGVKTTKNGCVVSFKDNSIPLAISGRLCKGVLLGTDAILECFGEPLKWWAEGVVERIDK